MVRHDEVVVVAQRIRTASDSCCLDDIPKEHTDVDFVELHLEDIARRDR